MIPVSAVMLLGAITLFAIPPVCNHIARSDDARNEALQAQPEEEEAPV